MKNTVRWRLTSRDRTEAKFDPCTEVGHAVDHRGIFPDGRDWYPNVLQH